MLYSDIAMHSLLHSSLSLQNSCTLLHVYTSLSDIIFLSVLPSYYLSPLSHCSHKHTTNLHLFFLYSKIMSTLYPPLLQPLLSYSVLYHNFFAKHTTFFFHIPQLKYIILQLSPSPFFLLQTFNSHKQTTTPAKSHLCPYDIAQCASNLSLTLLGTRGRGHQPLRGE